MNANLILEKLIKKYERRTIKSSENKQRIKLGVNDKELPEFFDDISESMEVIDQLLDMNFITIKMMKHSRDIEAIYLNIDNVDEIYTFLNKDNINKNIRDALNFLELYKDDITINKYKEKIQNKIYSKKSILEILNSKTQDAIKAVYYMNKNSKDIYERDFSNQLYNDSKRLAVLKNTIKQIYEDDSTDDELFIEKGILKNPTYIFLKGNGTISLNNQTIDLALIKAPIGVSSISLPSLKIISVEQVTTIENLTTFNDYTGDGLVIYLAGFSNNSKILLLNILKQHTSKFYHFGDIDFGGFSILNNLMETLDLIIQTINMDTETILKRKENVKTISDLNYIDKLKSLLTKPRLKEHYKTINYLIDNKVILEQEALFNN